MTVKHDTQRSIEILAKSVFKELKAQGYGRAEIVAFASNLLELLTDEVRGNATTREETRV